ncbi:molybdate ABC transporter substrate-binding protein [Pseudotabrizicola sp. 4114]|uniref:molybdate ABC transporter substrate-binding protein n=1 Tax=Pseudotabrizicola sp. 4114 TaxID=2817731 RepID=UPI0028576FA8|nr:molybdate transport system substrate-binding protein [Pseudorhodobacter sp. 4114]
MPTRRAFALCAAALALGAGPFGTPQPAIAQSGPPVIAAAADLSFAIEEIAARFKAETGTGVRLSLGSTGNFARQIREGAPFQMFMAADEQFVTDLHRDGFTRDAGTLYGIGRIVVMVPEGSTLVADGTLDSLRVALEAGQITRFAIANPEHAPYGQRAEEALRHAGLWDRVQPHLVLGENVSQAAQFALSGNAEGGIIAASLALAPGVAARGSHDLIPEDWHAPLRQRMVLLNSAGPEAEAFYAYLQTPPARAIMARYGFTLPQE